MSGEGDVVRGGADGSVARSGEERGARPALSSPPSPPSPPPPPPLGYGVRAIVAALPSATLESLRASAGGIAQTPCFRTALGWAAAVGALCAAHRLKDGGALRSCMHYAVAGFGGTFSLQWYLCRREEYDKRVALRAFYAMQRDQQHPGAGAATGGGAAAGAGAGAGGAPDWRRELEALTQYDRPLVTPAPGPPQGYTLR